MYENVLRVVGEALETQVQVGKVETNEVEIIVRTLGKILSPEFVEQLEDAIWLDNAANELNDADDHIQAVENLANDAQAGGLTESEVEQAMAEQN